MEYWLDQVVANALGIFGLVALVGVAGMLVSTASILHEEAGKLTTLARQQVSRSAATKKVVTAVCCSDSVVDNIKLATCFTVSA